MAEEKKLTPKQEAFIREYLVDKNGTQAAIRAGYPAASARTTGSILIANANIKALIDAGIDLERQDAAKRAKKFQLTKERWVKELQTIAFANMDDFVEVSENGINIKKTIDRKVGLGRAIKKLSESTSQHGGSMSLELHSKMDALEKIGKHFGWLNDKIVMEKAAPDRPLEHLSDEELDKL